MSLVFLSYASEDRERVSVLYDFLQARHGVVWADWVEIGNVPSWRARVLEQLPAASFVVAAMSPHYLASPHCKWERSRAKEHGIQIVGHCVSQECLEGIGDDSGGRLRWPGHFLVTEFGGSCEPPVSRWPAILSAGEVE